MALLFDPDAFNDITGHDAKRLMKKIDWMWEHRMEIVHFPLRENLSGFLKRTIGKYRIVYSYDSTSDEMIIHLVGLRATIYKNADKSLP